MPAQNMTASSSCWPAQMHVSGFVLKHPSLATTIRPVHRGSALVSEQNILDIGLHMLHSPFLPWFFLFKDQQRPACMSLKCTNYYFFFLSRHFKFQRLQILLDYWLQSCSVHAAWDGKCLALRLSRTCFIVTHILILEI